MSPRSKTTEEYQIGTFDAVQPNEPKSAHHVRSIKPTRKIPVHPDKSAIERRPHQEGLVSTSMLDPNSLRDQAGIRFLDNDAGGVLSPRRVSRRRDIHCACQ